MKRVLGLTVIAIAMSAGTAAADPLSEMVQRPSAPFLLQTSAPAMVDGETRYALGDRLPYQSEIIRDYRPYKLSPPPAGAYYARINQDLVLVSGDTHRILNLVGLVFSAS